VVKGYRVLVLNTSGLPVVIRKFQCVSCGLQVRATQKDSLVLERPVLHSMNRGTCRGCGTVHFVVGCVDQNGVEAMTASVARIYEEGL